MRTDIPDCTEVVSYTTGCTETHDCRRCKAHDVCIGDLAQHSLNGVLDVVQLQFRCLTDFPVLQVNNTETNVFSSAGEQTESGNHHTGFHTGDISHGILNPFQNCTGTVQRSSGGKFNVTEDNPLIFFWQEAVLHFCGEEVDQSDSNTEQNDCHDCSADKEPDKETVNLSGTVQSLVEAAEVERDIVVRFPQNCCTKRGAQCHSHNGGKTERDTHCHSKLDVDVTHHTAVESERCVTGKGHKCCCDNCPGNLLHTLDCSFFR